MDIAKFRHKLAIVAKVEIVVPLLPELFGLANQTARYALHAVAPFSFAADRG